MTGNGADKPYVVTSDEKTPKGTDQFDMITLTGIDAWLFATGSKPSIDENAYAEASEKYAYDPQFANVTITGLRLVDMEGNQIGTIAVGNNKYLSTEEIDESTILVDSQCHAFRASILERAIPHAFN